MSLRRSVVRVLHRWHLPWVLRRDEVASVLIGASRVSQLEDNVAALEHLDFDEEELTTIDTILGKDPGHMIR